MRNDHLPRQARDKHITKARPKQERRDFCWCVCVCVCVADDAWTTWPGYPGCLGLGDTFATSLYTVPEYEATRETYRRTVAYAYVVIVNTSAY